MKIVAVTQRLTRDEKTLEIREALDINWAKLFEAVEIVPVMVPIAYDFKKYFQEINFAGVVLTGGNDLSSLDQNELSIMRDQRERELIAWAVKQGLPLWGVCRGMQLVAEYFGASVIKIKGHVGNKHNISINKQSAYQQDLAGLTVVNSFHNYAVKNIGQDVMASAWSEDGEIEALEHRQYKIFCQMWHPERENPFKKEDLGFIKKYFCD